MMERGSSLVRKWAGRLTPGSFLCFSRAFLDKEVLGAQVAPTRVYRTSEEAQNTDRSWDLSMYARCPYGIRKLSSDSGARKSKKAMPLQERKMIDKFRLHVRGGAGGAGCTSFRKSRQTRHGSVDGGNGGRGGSVILVSSAAVWDFSNLQHHLNGSRGGPGSSKKRVGSRGLDKIVQVPVGTVIHLVRGSIPSLELVQPSKDESIWDDWEDMRSDMRDKPLRDSWHSKIESHNVGEVHHSQRICDLEHGGTHELETATAYRKSCVPLVELSKQTFSVDGSNLTAEVLHSKLGDYETNMPSQVWDVNDSRDAISRAERKDGSADNSSSDDSSSEDSSSDVSSSHDYSSDDNSSDDNSSDQEIQSSVLEFIGVGQSFIVACGGEGGKGNAAMARGRGSEKALPSLEHEQGQTGSEADLILELKSIADVGLVGAPNAGKSTLLGSLSRAKPTTGHYKFTTLRPNIGMIEYEDFFNLTVADIPGLIEGAHENRGLGHAFLRHIERTKVLAYVVDLAGGLGDDTGPLPWDQFEELVSELELYQKGLSQRPSLIVANKIDEEGALAALEELRRKVPSLQIYPVCAVLDEGIEALKVGFRNLVESLQTSSLPLSRLREL